MIQEIPIPILILIAISALTCVGLLLFGALGWLYDNLSSEERKALVIFYDKTDSGCEMISIFTTYSFASKDIIERLINKGMVFRADKIVRLTSTGRRIAYHLKKKGVRYA